MIHEIRELRIKTNEFPILLKKHRCKYPGTPCLEAEAAALAKNDFNEITASEFVRSVCRWGGYAGIASRVIYSNKPAKISCAFRLAYSFAKNGDVLEGLRTINILNGLGRPSFASKHLRFLAPRSAVILDSVLSQRLGYALNLNGYEELLCDCARLTDEVKRTGIKNPLRPKDRWYISDIEAAIFAKLQGY